MLRLISHIAAALLTVPETECAQKLAARSEEHTSELQSQSNLVCRIIRSEEHTSELHQISYAVFCLKKKRKRLNSSHSHISYAVFCLKNKTTHATTMHVKSRITRRLILMI